jgi:hypothetical protein
MQVLHTGKSLRPLKPDAVMSQAAVAAIEAQEELDASKFLFTK